MESTKHYINIETSLSLGEGSEATLRSPYGPDDKSTIFFLRCSFAFVAILRMKSKEKMEMENTISHFMITSEG